jgi:hypothetical protein
VKGFCEIFAPEEQERQRALMEKMRADLADRCTPLKLPRDANPAHVMSLAKRAAVKYFWMLSTWVQFSDEARATLDPSASEESFVKFREVVAKWFYVEETP